MESEKWIAFGACTDPLAAFTESIRELNNSSDCLTPGRSFNTA